MEPPFTQRRTPFSPSIVDRRWPSCNLALLVRSRYRSNQHHRRRAARGNELVRWAASGHEQRLTSAQRLGRPGRIGGRNVRIALDNRDRFKRSPCRPTSQRSSEIGSFEEKIRGSHDLTVARAAFLPYLGVPHTIGGWLQVRYQGGLVEVQLSNLAIWPFAVPIVQSVSGFARLLHFVEKNTSADGVDR